MKESRAEDIIKRMKTATGFKRQTQLAELFKIGDQGLSAAKTKQQVPIKWIKCIVENYAVSFDWLCYGIGEMKPLDAESPVVLKGRICELEATIAGLEKELFEGYKDNKELSQENRQLSQENKQLSQENRQLRDEKKALKS